MTEATAPPRRFRAKDCFGGYHGCEIVYVPTNGRQKRCPACSRVKGLEELRTPEHAARKRKWRLENPQRHLEHTARAKRRATIRRTPEEAHDYGLRKKHHLTLAGKVAIMLADGNLCPVCGQPAYDPMLMFVDHDHKCCPVWRSCGGCIRGVVHPRCNSLLGIVEPMGFTHAYLDSAPERMRRNDAIRLAHPHPHPRSVFVARTAYAARQRAA